MKTKITCLIIFMSLCLFLSISSNCKKSTAPGSGVVYFLVSEINPFHGDSFILPLTDPEDIEFAEKIVADINSTTSRIVSARIARGSGGGSYLNKDLSSGSSRVWSWHVVEFFDFVDVTIEIQDSRPTYVEENLDRWMQQNNGMIGFWSYTVTRKVDISELQ
ncbi:MAG: hypothetical protein KAW12_16385 [Candidatus Aminicenantes bacterium]|nr:hypothetical protein [Candidatus Aminicenantes bacterium]